MDVSKNKEMRTWSGQKYSQGSEVSELCQVSIPNYWYVVEPQIPTKKKKTREIKIWRWTERDFIVIDVGNGCVKEEMICNTCNKPHLQGKRVARARQTSRTCKADKYMAASWFKAWSKLFWFLLTVKCGSPGYCLLSIIQSFSWPKNC